MAITFSIGTHETYIEPSFVESSVTPKYKVELFVTRTITPLYTNTFVFSNVTPKYKTELFLDEGVVSKYILFAENTLSILGAEI